MRSSALDESGLTFLEVRLIRPAVRAISLGTVIVLAAAAQPARRSAGPAAITVDYPADGSIFPPEFPAPLFLWRDPTPGAAEWAIEIAFPDGAPPITVKAKGERMQIGEIDPRAVAPTNALPKLTPQQATARTWRPDEATWAAIKRHSAAGLATIRITGHAATNPNRPLSSGQVAIRTSTDPVGAPIFYRDVPLMPSATEKGVIKPLANSALPLIAWRLRDVAATKSRMLMAGLHTCANCHSVSRDGKTLGMDVDGPQNDKGLYAIVPVQQHMSIRDKDVVAWSTFRGKLGGKLRVGFMSQISPDGEYVVTTINDPGVDEPEYQRRKSLKEVALNYYVANFKDYRFLQVFYPTRGILAWYNRASWHLQPLPGADDPRYVHTNAVWSPDGRYLVFARAEARDPYAPGAKTAQFANDPNETRLRYDLYRIPFNGGKGGVAEPVAGASNNGRSNSFPKVSPDGRWIVYVQSRNGQLMRPDSKLFIVPAEGGKARLMNCNTPLMNSWHSFSPNGRWMVFSSKSRSPYTQMFLTHIDEAGNDSPAILIENSTAANRAVNIPEFINVPADGIANINAPVTDYYRVVDVASDLMKKGENEAAAAEWRKALELSPNEALAHNNLGVTLSETGKVDEAVEHYRKAIELSPEYPEAHNNLGEALIRQRRLDEAMEHFARAIQLNPRHASAYSNLGAALAQQGRLQEAIPHLERAVELKPEVADVQNNLGIALAMTGRLEEAIPHLEKALAATHGSFEGHFVLGRVLAATKKFREAMPHLERAVRISGGRDASLLAFYAGVCAEAGRFTQAAAVARQALAVADAQGDQQLSEQIKARLRLYESGRSAP